MSDFSQRLRWMFFECHRQASKLPGFWASIWSYAADTCEFSPNVKIFRKARLTHGTLGRMSYLAAGAQLGCCEGGAFASIGPGALIGSLGKHPTNLISSHPTFCSTLGQVGQIYATQDQFPELVSTSLGNDIWACARAIVLDGCRIGDGAILAAGAVVTKDVPAYTIGGGVPAKFIRSRFNTDVIAVLTNWPRWDLPDAVLVQLAKDFTCSTDWTAADIVLLRQKAGQLMQDRVLKLAVEFSHG